MFLWIRIRFTLSLIGGVSSDTSVVEYHKLSDI